MNPSDDRAQFAEHQSDVARAVAADEPIQARSLELLGAAHRLDYSHAWRWLGVPIIQMPTDVMVLQEIVWEHRPQLIVETGVARGGSVIFFASMLQLIGEGTVVGIDIDIRAHNRDSIEDHPLAHRVHLIEGSSTDAATVAAVADLVAGHERVMVVLDSNHTHDHVLEELRAYSGFVTPGQILVVADTWVEHLPPLEHVERPWKPGNSPASAMDAFLAETDEFAPDEIANGKLLMSSSPGGYLRRRA